MTKPFRESCLAFMFTLKSWEVLSSLPILNTMRRHYFALSRFSLRITFYLRCFFVSLRLLFCYKCFDKRYCYWRFAYYYTRLGSSTNSLPITIAILATFNFGFYGYIKPSLIISFFSNNFYFFFFLLSFFFSSLVKYIGMGTLSSLTF